MNRLLKEKEVDYGICCQFFEHSRRCDSLFCLRGSDPITARNALWLGAILAAAATVAFLAIYASYNSVVGAARERVLAGSKVIETARGPIEYTTYGQGSPVLVIHGAGGGYDQGLVTAKRFVGEGYLSIIPSRFGYLRTPNTNQWRYNASCSS